VNTADNDVWLGIDLGTSAVKVVAIDVDGQVKALENNEYPVHSPQAGWVEQDPADWWEATERALASVVADVGPGSVRGIGLSAQMHGMVALDDQDQVLRQAILWNDNRNADECDWLIEHVGGLDALLAMTNNTMLPGFTTGKVIWFRKHEPELFAKMARVLNPKDYLRLRLTGKHLTEVSDASGTGAFDVRRRQWSTDLLKALDLATDLYPEAIESPDVSGTLVPEVAERIGLPTDVPVVGGGGDAVLQTTAMGVVEPGSIGITLGTAGIVAAGADHCPENPGGRVQVSCGNAPGRWHIMGVSLATGGALDWWRYAIEPMTGEKPSAGALAVLADKSEPGARGAQFLPYLVGERCPHVDPDARAAWVDLDLRHTVADMSRAVIEGALLNLRQVRDLIIDAGVPCDHVRVSGGASAHKIWNQTLADIFGQELHTVTGGEQGAAFGAALLAGVGTGVWSSLPEALESVQVERTIVPEPENVPTYNERYHRFLQLHPALEHQSGAVAL
jgi:xylulokinase